MFGDNKITRCPYCGKLSIESMGATTYYKYKDKIVRISSHCGKEFLTSDYEDVKLDRYDIPLGFANDYINDIKDIIIANLDGNISEEEIRDIVVNNLRRTHDEKDVSVQLNNIYCIVDAIAGQININAIYSEPLTDEVRNALECISSVCY